jgi:ferredoxin
VRIDIDAGKCVGAGQCAWAAPDVFNQDEDTGTIIVLDDSPPAEQDALIREAAMMCPAGVISVSD